MNVMPTAYINGLTFWVLKPIDAMKQALRLTGLSMIQSVGCRQIPTTVPRFRWLANVFCSQWSIFDWGEVEITAARDEYRLCWSKQATEQWTGFPTSHTDNDSSSCESEQISLQHNILHLWFK